MTPTKGTMAMAGAMVCSLFTFFDSNFIPCSAPKTPYLSPVVFIFSVLRLLQLNSLMLDFSHLLHHVR